MFKNKPLRWSIFYIPSRDKIIERLYQLVHERLHPFKNSHLTRMKAYSQPKFMGVLLKKKKKKNDGSYWTCTCTMHPLIYIYIYIYFEQLYNLVYEILPPSNKMATWLEWKLTQPKFLVVIQRMYYNMKNDKIIIIFII